MPRTQKLPEIDTRQASDGSYSIAITLNSVTVTGGLTTVIFTAKNAANGADDGNWQVGDFFFNGEYEIPVNHRRDKMEKTAVIIGATGAVGKEILKKILADDFYNKVYILGRQSIDKLADEERLTKIIVDFENLNFETDILNNADVFASLGTTIKIAKTKENQRKIDLDYTINFAKICEGKIRSFNVVSAIGANSRSKSFYTSLKGELEERLQEMNLGILRIYRPSLLISRRIDTRIMEEFFIKISPMLKPILHGKFKKYSPIEVGLLGKEIVRFAIEYKEKGIYTYSDFKEA